MFISLTMDTRSLWHGAGNMSNWTSPGESLLLPDQKTKEPRCAGFCKCCQLLQVWCEFRACVCCRFQLSAANCVFELRCSKSCLATGISGAGSSVETLK